MEELGAAAVEAAAAELLDPFCPLAAPPPLDREEAPLFFLEAAPCEEDAEAALLFALPFPRPQLLLPAAFGVADEDAPLRHVEEASAMFNSFLFFGGNLLLDRSRCAIRLQLLESEWLPMVCGELEDDSQHLKEERDKRWSDGVKES